MLAEKKFYLTKRGLKRLEKEYRDLKTLKLTKTEGESPKILESEDLNPEYLSFQEDISFLEARLTELEYILKNAELIKPPPRTAQNIVNLGATVTLEDSDGHINEFMITGSLETNPNEGKISIGSPVGRALLGHRTGEEIVIVSPIKVFYKIKKISYHSL